MSALVAVATVEVVLHTHAPADTVLRRNLWTHTHYLYELMRGSMNRTIISVIFITHVVQLLFL